MSEELSKKQIAALSELTLSDAEYDIWISVYAKHFQYCYNAESAIQLADKSIIDLRKIAKSKLAHDGLVGPDGVVG